MSPIVRLVRIENSESVWLGGGLISNVRWSREGQTVTRFEGFIDLRTFGSDILLTGRQRMKVWTALLSLIRGQCIKLTFGLKKQAEQF